MIQSVATNTENELNNDTKDRIAEEEEAYFDRRLEELSAGQHWNRSDLYHKINEELAQIRANRNAP